MQLSLSALVRTYPCACSLIEVVARNYPRCRALSATRAQLILESVGENYSMNQIATSLQKMAEAGLGKARWNSEAEEFTFEWSYLPAAAGEMIRTGQSIDMENSNAQDPEEDGPGTGINDPMQHHRFLLRSDCTIGLDLPENLSKIEALKIYK